MKKIILIGVAIVLIVGLFAAVTVRYERHEQARTQFETAQAQQESIIKQVDAQNLSNAQTQTASQTNKLTNVCAYIRTLTPYSTTKTPINLPSDCQ